MRQRNIGYDFIRIIAIFLVVVIHSNVVYLAKEQGTVGWYFVTLCTSACLVAVPLFFMVSGALLLDTNEVTPLKKLFFKRILKQAIPFILWSLIYVLARIVLKKISFGAEAFFSLLYEPAYYQFWFMYTLLAIYLLLPVLQAVVLKLGKRHLEYVLILWFVFSTVFPVMQKFIPGFAISGHVDLVLCEGYVGYFLLGFYLKKYHADVSWVKGICLTIIGLFTTIIACIIEWENTSKLSYQGYFYQSYLTPFVVLAASGIFLLFQNLNCKQKETPNRLLRTGAECSLGVYYVHMLVLTAIEHLGLIGDDHIGLLAIKIVLIYGISFVLAFVISKVPYVKKVLLGL